MLSRMQLRAACARSCRPVLDLQRSLPRGLSGGLEGPSSFAFTASVNRPKLGI